MTATASSTIVHHDWPLIPAYGDSALMTLVAVEGSRNVRGGDVHKVFTLFCADYAKEVEPIKKADSWGYSPRRVTNGTSWSRHASGTAIDLNSSKYPMYRNYMSASTQAKVRALLRRYPIIRWGGDYSAAYVDQMHFEINCTQAELNRFLSSKGTPVAAPRMTSPVTGYISSRYGIRNGTLHAGADVATGGKPGTVRTVYAGVVVRVVRGRKPGSRAYDSYAPHRTGNYIAVENPDGEVEIYNHVLADAGIYVGKRVGVGDRLGVTDLSGNSSGYHLHLEIWNKNRKTRNPEIDFRVHGVTLGSPSYVPPTTQAPVTPPPTPAPAPSKGDPAVLAWQKRANQYGKAGLVEDGIRGPVSIAWENWVKSLQRALNAWKAVTPKLRVDGDYGAGTDRGVYQVQKANPKHFGYADRVVGSKTTSALGIGRKP